MELTIKIGIAVVIYMLPTLIALMRRYKNIKPILTVNLVLGWTVIVWISLLGLVIKFGSYGDYVKDFEQKNQ